MPDSSGWRFLIAGGGTGGHIIPALAIADALKAQHDAQILFVGTARGLESRLVPQAGYPLELIRAGQLNQVSVATRLRTVADLPRAAVQCVRLLRSFRPSAVIGVGGYASGPVMAGAILLRVPTLAFEPNAVPGMANRWIGRWVQAAAVNFPDTLRYFRNGHVTGIPVRPEFFALPPRPVDAPPRLLVFGGSQGARVLNRTMPLIAADLLEAVPGLTILHQSGARNVEGTRQAYLQSPELRGHWSASWSVEPFLDDMPARFGDASLVLCRSGASTVAELAAARKPSLLIPFPQAADNHQCRNAEVFAQAGAAAMLVEAELTPPRLLAELVRLFRDPKGLACMGQKARSLAHEDAAASIAALIQQLHG